MAWWVWLLSAWAVLACVAGVWIALALRNAEHREWVRHGRVERRRHPREPAPGGPA